MPRNAIVAVGDASALMYFLIFSAAANGTTVAGMRLALIMTCSPHDSMLPKIAPANMPRSHTTIFPANMVAFSFPSSHIFEPTSPP